MLFWQKKSQLKKVFFWEAKIKKKSVRNCCYLPLKVIIYSILTKAVDYKNKEFLGGCVIKLFSIVTDN